MSLFDATSMSKLMDLDACNENITIEENDKNNQIDDSGMPPSSATLSKPTLLLASNKRQWSPV